MKKIGLFVMALIAAVLGSGLTGIQARVYAGSHAMLPPTVKTGLSADVQPEAWAWLQKAYQAHGGDRLKTLKNMVRYDRTMYYDKDGKPGSSACNQDAYDFEAWRYHTTGWGVGSIYIVQAAQGRTPAERQGFQWFEGKGTKPFTSEESQNLLYRLSNEVTYILGHLELITSARVVGPRTVRGMRGTAITTYNDDPNDPAVFLIADDGTVLAAKDGTDFDNEKNLEIYRDYRMVKGIKVNFEHFYPDSKEGDYLVKAVDVRVNVRPEELEKHFAVKEGTAATAEKQVGLRLYSNDNQDFSGFVVGKLTEGGPAAKAGLQLGDVLLEVDGVNVEQADHLTPIRLGGEAGTVVALTVKRRDQTLKFSLIRGP